MIYRAPRTPNFRHGGGDSSKTFGVFHGYSVLYDRYSGELSFAWNTCVVVMYTHIITVILEDENVRLSPRELR